MLVLPVLPALQAKKTKTRKKTKKNQTLKMTLAERSKALRSSLHTCPTRAFILYGPYMISCNSLICINLVCTAYTLFDLHTPGLYVDA